MEMGLESEDLNKAKLAWPIVQRNLERINGLILNMLAFSKADSVIDRERISSVITSYSIH